MKRYFTVELPELLYFFMDDSSQSWMYGLARSQLESVYEGWKALSHLTRNPIAHSDVILLYKFWTIQVVNAFALKANKPLSLQSQVVRKLVRVSFIKAVSDYEQRHSYRAVSVPLKVSIASKIQIE